MTKTKLPLVVVDGPDDEDWVKEVTRRRAAQRSVDGVASVWAEASVAAVAKNKGWAPGPNAQWRKVGDEPSKDKRKYRKTDDEVKQMRENRRKWLADAIKGLIDRRAEGKGFQRIDKTQEEIEEECVKRLKEIAEGRVCVQADIESAVGILEDGEFLTQFDTSTTNGLFNPDIRLAAEANGLGYPTDINAEPERPVYGYIERERGADLVEDYGTIKFVIEDDVRDRTTMTYGDSLGPMYNGYIIASPLSDPGIECCMIDHIKEMGLGIDTLYSVSYVEAQIQGELRVQDIAGIELTEYDLEYGHAPSYLHLLEMAQDYGIKVTVFDKHGEEVEPDLEHLRELADEFEELESAEGWIDA